MKGHSSSDVPLHCLLSVIGGFLGAYSILARCNFFGSAQTANMIFMISDVFGHNWGDIAIRLGALILFSAAIALSAFLRPRFTCHLKLLCVLIDAIAVLILGFLPQDMDPVLALYPMFFAMAFQWCSFPGTREYSSSTTFSTNNLRQFVTALTGCLTDRHPEHLRKLKFYGAALFSFHAGVFLSIFFWSILGIRSVWLCLIPIAFAGFILAPNTLRAISISTLPAPPCPVSSRQKDSIPPSPGKQSVC